MPLRQEFGGCWFVMDYNDKAIWFDFPTHRHSSVTVSLFSLSKSQHHLWLRYSCIFYSIWILKWWTVWKIHFLGGENLLEIPQIVQNFKRNIDYFSFWPSTITIYIQSLLITCENSWSSCRERSSEWFHYRSYQWANPKSQWDFRVFLLSAL